MACRAKPADSVWSGCGELERLESALRTCLLVFFSRSMAVSLVTGEEVGSSGPFWCLLPAGDKLGKVFSSLHIARRPWVSHINTSSAGQRVGWCLILIFALSSHAHHPVTTNRNHYLIFLFYCLLGGGL